MGIQSTAVIAALKQELLQQPILKLLTPSGQTNFKPFQIQTDASDVAIAAVLAQEDENGKEHPCLYASRQLSMSERNYSVSERECLALVFAVGKWRPYLWGHPFVVWTDHAALTFLMSAKGLVGRLARWALTLQQYEIIIKHRAGKLNTNADALSRLQWGTESLPVLLGESTHRFLEEICVMAEETLPQEGDGQGVRQRLKEVSKRSHDSVMMFTRSANRRETTPQTVKVLPDKVSISATIRHWPKQLVWSKEIWVSTASWAAMKAGLPSIEHLTRKTKKKSARRCSEI